MRDEQVVAAMFDDEWKASLACETLRAAGIPAAVSGGLTGSFRTEAPGRVKVMVRAMDLERAEAALKQCREDALSIDWSKVDVDDPDTDDADDAQGETN